MILHSSVRREYFGLEGELLQCTCLDLFTNSFASRMYTKHLGARDNL